VNEKQFVAAAPVALLLAERQLLFAPEGWKIEEAQRPVALPLEGANRKMGGCADAMIGAVSTRRSQD